MSSRAHDDPEPGAGAAPSAEAAQVWLLLSDLVLDHSRKREVAEALGISFARARAVRRLARRPMTMRELAAALGVDPPNATVVVDELESLGLVKRGPHPTDRRAKLVDVTRKGRQLAARADTILAMPPPGLTALDADDLATLRRLLDRVAGRE
jgi:DNA-binding MarR family transcriptional regulator